MHHEQQVLHHHHHDPFSDWKGMPERYTLKRLLGSGSYGDVAEAFDNVEGRKVAIKRVDGLREEVSRWYLLGRRCT